MCFRVILIALALATPLPACAEEAAAMIGGGTDMPVGRMVLGLAFCLGVLMLGVAIARRYGITTVAHNQRRMKLLERLPISAKSSLVLVDIDGVTHCVAVGSERVTAVGASKSPHAHAAEFLQHIEEESCGSACTISS